MKDWKQKIPKEDGTYWYKDRATKPVKVERLDGRIYFMDYGGKYSCPLQMVHERLESEEIYFAEIN